MYIWNRADRVPNEHTSNITKSFNGWLVEQNNKLNKATDLKTKRNLKNKIRSQTIAYENAISSIPNNL